MCDDSGWARLSGGRQIAGWYLADPARQVVDGKLDALMDKLALAWRSSLEA